MERKLTLKQRKFIKYYLETGNASQSALKAGYAHRESARPLFSNVLIKNLLKRLMDEMGITDRKLLKVLNDGLEAKKIIGYLNSKVQGTQKVSDEFLEVPDHYIRHKYLNTALEMKRYLKETINQLTIDQSEHTHYVVFRNPQALREEQEKQDSNLSPR